jgi:ATP-dependent Clp protease ATP-binding subunit ClpC
MWELCTEGARKALLGAQEEALRLDHDYAGSGHLLLGLLGGGNGDPAAEVLRSFGVTLDRGRAWIEDRVGRGQQGSRSSSRRPQFTRRSKKAIELALREAKIIRQELMGTDHILLELLREGEEPAMSMLIDLGAEPEAVRREVERMRDVEHPT